MIILLGSSGYVGSAFVRYFEQRGIPYQALRRSSCDIYSPTDLAHTIRETRGSFLINCAGFTGKPNVDACEHQKIECLLANACLPGLIQTACEQAQIPWGHVSSGCIYTGEPASGQGFDEAAAPNFTFRQNNCSFYSGTKALGEECLAEARDCYIWRLRIPFDHVHNSRNYLSKVMNYARLLDARNSLSQLDEFVECCFKCWELKLDYGIYNLTNGGSVTTREVVAMIKKHGLVKKEFHFFDSEAEFMQQAAIAPRSNTVLDSSKAVAAGLPLSDVYVALESALSRWQN